MERLQHEHDRLLSNHLFTQGVAYFLFAFLFLRAYDLADRGAKSQWDIPAIGSFTVIGTGELVPLTFSFVCVGVSAFLGAASFAGSIRRWKWTGELIEVLEKAFAPAALAGLLLTWLNGLIPLLDRASPLVPVFFWPGVAWFVVLSGRQVYASWSLRSEQPFESGRSDAWLSVRLVLRRIRSRLHHRRLRNGLRSIGLMMKVALNYWLLWAPLIAAGGLYYLGRVLVASQGFHDFHVNLIVEGVGIAAAFAFVWWLIERRSQQQARRVQQGVHRRIYVVRNWAAWPVTYLTQLVFGEPSDETRGGPLYVRDNYHSIRKLIGVPESQNVLPIQHPTNKRLSDVPIRSVPRVGWILATFVQLSESCEQTLRLYAPGLAEYPEVLAALERVRNNVESEQRRWREFEKKLSSEREARDERNRRNMEMGQPLERGEPFEDLLPPEALSNLLSLSADALGLTAAITLILGDWEDPPVASDVELSGGFWIWPSSR